MNANYPRAGIIPSHMENQRSNYGKALPVFAESKRAEPYAFLHVTPGGQCHMLTPVSPFSAFCISQCPKGYAEREERKQPQHEEEGAVGWFSPLTHFVRPSLLLASTQNSCLTLERRSL